MKKDTDLVEFIRHEAHEAILTLHEDICGTVGEDWRGIDDNTDSKKLPLLEGEIRRDAEEGEYTSFQIEIVKLLYEGHSVYGKEGRIRVIQFIRANTAAGGEKVAVEWICGRLYGYADMLKKLAGRSKRLMDEANEYRSWSYISAAVED